MTLKYCLVVKCGVRLLCSQSCFHKKIAYWQVRGASRGIEEHEALIGVRQKNENLPDKSKRREEERIEITKIENMHASMRASSSSQASCKSYNLQLLLQPTTTNPSNI